MVRERNGVAEHDDGIPSFYAHTLSGILSIRLGQADDFLDEIEGEILHDADGCPPPLAWKFALKVCHPSLR
jgi:hypothetical protein